MAVKTLIEAIRDGLREEMERDERMIIFGEDVGPRGGVFGVTDGFPKQFGADRVHRHPAGRVAHRRASPSARRRRACCRSPRSSLPTSSSRP